METYGDVVLKEEASVHHASSKKSEPTSLAITLRPTTGAKFASCITSLTVAYAGMAASCASMSMVIQRPAGMSASSPLALNQMTRAPSV
ncbi:hypothetical protein [Paracoccus beibuensis]|uniref:hypothetical protein n=1 Tax=Paracoccus beibuensis TaxID=547602 RepID=UPI00223F11AA|nr:hypothetical protein [Paracoccus beibuensis]